MKRAASLFLAAGLLAAFPVHAADKPRARDLGVPFDGTPGPGNAITDVRGVTVGHSTIIRGAGALKVGEGPVRTGVTAVVPRGKATDNDPVFAGWFALNGNGGDDRHDLGRGVGLSRGARHDHQHPQRRHGARRDDRVADQAGRRGRDRVLVVATPWWPRPGTAT